MSVASTSSIDDQLGIVASDGTQRNEKKNLNNDAVEQKRGSFTQILKTCEGVLYREAEAFVDRLPRHLYEKWDNTYS